MMCIITETDIFAHNRMDTSLTRSERFNIFLIFKCFSTKAVNNKGETRGFCA